MTKQLKKILIIRFSSIGDIVLTSAVVRCLKEQSGAEIHFLTKTQYEPILRNNPNIDKTWQYDHNFKELIPQLKSQGFDFIVDLHRNIRSRFVISRVGVESASFPKLNLRKWLAVRFKMNILPDIHIVERYFIAVAPLNVKNDGRGLDYFIPPADEVSVSGLPDKYHHGFLAIVIGGKHNTKIFPAERVAEVCNRISLPVILLGGKEDRERGDRIAGMTGANVYNTCGLYNLNQSASLIRQAAAVLTNDTGLMHVAAAFSKPIVSVWGNTIPAFGMVPYLPEKFKSNSMIAEVKGLPCRPCSKLGFKECPKKHFNCMQQIDMESIEYFLTGNRIVSGEIVNPKS